MNANNEALKVLSEQQCFEKLSSHVLGRLVTRVGEIVDIFPVNYVLDDNEIVLRTAEGTKLLEMVVGGEVLFEVDHFDDLSAWSVVVRGTARVLETEAEILAADALPLKPMVPTMKRNYVRIAPNTITGRTFSRSEEPPRDGPQDY